MTLRSMLQLASGIESALQKGALISEATPKCSKRTGQVSPSHSGQLKGRHSGWQGAEGGVAGLTVVKVRRQGSQSPEAPWWLHGGSMARFTTTRAAAPGHCGSVMGRGVALSLRLAASFLRKRDTGPAGRKARLRGCCPAVEPRMLPATVSGRLLRGARSCEGARPCQRPGGPAAAQRRPSGPAAQRPPGADALTLGPRQGPGLPVPRRGPGRGGGVHDAVVRREQPESELVRFSVWRKLPAAPGPRTILDAKPLPPCAD